jgi:hypothetical protein
VVVVVVVEAVDVVVRDIAVAVDAALQALRRVATITPKKRSRARGPVVTAKRIRGIPLKLAVNSKILPRGT